MLALFNTKVNVPVIEVGKIKENTCNLSVVSSDEQLRQNLMRDMNSKVLHPNLAMKKLNDDATIINIIKKENEEVIHKESKKVNSVNHKVFKYRNDEQRIKDLKIVEFSSGISKCKDVIFNLNITIIVEDRNKNQLFTKIYHMDEVYTRCEHNYARIPYYKDVYGKLERIISRKIAADLMTKYTIEYVFLDDDLDIQLTSSQNDTYKLSFQYINKMDYISAIKLSTKLNDEISSKSYLLLLNLGLLYEGAQDYKNAKKYLKKAQAKTPKTDTKTSDLIKKALDRIKSNINIINNIGECIKANN